MTSHEDNISNPFPPLSSLQRLAISESGFVFDPVSGHNFTVNETGLSILRLLQKDTEVEPVLELLSTEYDAPIRDIERDVLEFAGVLRDFVGD